MRIFCTIGGKSPAHASAARTNARPHVGGRVAQNTGAALGRALGHARSLWVQQSTSPSRRV
eukprot:3704562-Prymnesium_polylepis.1